MKKGNHYGFTIVELLVVIVVIGVLATITIVAYAGISQRAISSSLQSDLDNASKQLKLFQIDNGNYPVTIDCAIPDSITNECIKASGGTSYRYSANNSVNSQTFCINAVNGNQSYKMTQDGVSLVGDCLGYGLVLDLDPGDSSSYPGLGTSWTDISGNGNNGTLVGGVTYSNANHSSLGFNGLDAYVSVGGLNYPSTWSDPLTIIVWLYIPSSAEWTNGFYGNIITRGTYAGSHGLIRLTTDNKIAAWFRGANASISVAGVITRDSWHQCVSIWTGDQAELFIDGVFIGSSLPTTLTGTPTATNWYIALAKAFSGASGDYLNGSIGDVRIYNRLLSAGEVTQEFNTLRERYGL